MASAKQIEGRTLSPVERGEWSERAMRSIFYSPCSILCSALPCRRAEDRVDSRSSHEQPAEVMRGGHEQPLAADFSLPAQQEPQKPAGLFGLTKDRLDNRLAHLVHGPTRLGPEFAPHSILHRESGGNPAPWRWRDRLAMLHFLRRDVGIDLGGHQRLDRVLAEVAGIRRERSEEHTS